MPSDAPVTLPAAERWTAPAPAAADQPDVVQLPLARVREIGCYNWGWIALRGDGTPDPDRAWKCGLVSEAEAHASARLAGFICISEYVPPQPQPELSREEYIRSVRVRAPHDAV